MQHLLDQLNDTQREAATHLDSPLMIIAGAGSGKTRVITYRIAFLSREVGIPLNRILAVTFTNKAAKEMRARVAALLDLPNMPSLPIGTFHSRCAMILRMEAEAAGLDKNFAILDENDQRQAIKKTLKEMKIPEKRAKPAQVQSFINQSKMRLLTPEDCKEGFDEGDVPFPDIYDYYQKMIQKNKSIDFEDLLMKTCLLFQECDDIRQTWAKRYQYILIDEYQDTNHAQFLLTKLLAQDHRQICVVGDEDQSIYSWRGAEISNLLDFEQSFPGTKLVKLEQNYRSTQTILKAANHVIARNTQRIGKELYTKLGEGEPIRAFVTRSHNEEATRIAQDCLTLLHDGIDANDIAIFYRGHWLSRSIEDQFRQYRLPYRIVGGIKFYDRAEIKDLLSFLRLSVNPDDDLAFERVVNKPTRGVGAKTLSLIAERAVRDRTSLFKATFRMNEEGQFKGKARKGLDSFTEMVRQWFELSLETDAGAVLKSILAETNYLEDGLGDTTSLEAESKKGNIEEFQGMLDEFLRDSDDKSTAFFLNTMALDAAQDTDDHSSKISLLTIHNAKGLEFDHVYTIGMEHGIFPSRRAVESMEEYALEEERRLFYVAVTRAKKRLTLSYAAQRNRPDFFSNNPPSQFLTEMPPEVFDEASRSDLRRLLPYSWGTTPDGDRQVVLDEDAAGQSNRSPRMFARKTQGLGGRSPFASARESKPVFDVGKRVNHRYMGEGVITDLGGRPGWERAMVEFDDGRSQEFVLKYAPLTLIEP